MGDARQLNAAIRYFEKACHENTKLLRDRSRKDAERNLSEGAQQHGLKPEEISILVKCICSKNMTDTTRKFLTKCLLPNSIVSCDSVLTCLSWMNTDEASNAVKLVIFCWIIAVFELIDDLENLYAIYGIIFYYVHSDILRPHACALLNLLTRREDIRLYRVQRLLRLRASVGNDPSLNSILLLYKYYCPHLVTIKIPSSLTGLSTHHYKAWSDRIKDIKARNGKVPNHISNYQNSKIFWNIENQVSAAELPRKNKLDEYLPLMTDKLGPLLFLAEKDKESVPFHTITSLDHFIHSIENIELPREALMGLRYQLAWHLISLRKDHDYLARFSFRLHMIFNTDFYHDDIKALASDKLLLLSQLTRFSWYLQEGIPVVESFISDFLSNVWNGEEFIDHILFFITRLRLRSIDDLKRVLHPIERAFAAADIKFKVSVLRCLIDLLDNMMNVEFDRCHEVEKAATQSFGLPQLTVQQDLLQPLYLFDEETGDFIPLLTIVHVIETIHKLCVTGLILCSTNTHLTHTIISFYTLALDIVCKLRLPFIKIPPPMLVYGALFSVDGVAIAKIGSLLCRCRDAFYVVKKAGPYKRTYPELNEQSMKQITLLNQYALDVSSTLWRSKAFMRPKGYSSIFDIPGEVIAEVDDPFVTASLTILQHPAFIGHAFICDKTVSKLTEDFGVLPEKMTKTSVVPYLNFLKDLGLDGISQFVEKFLKGPSEDN